MFSGRIETSTLSPGLMPSGRATWSVSPTGHFERAWGDHPGRQEIDQPHEVGDHAVGRPGIDLLRRAVLLQPAAVDHGDLVGQRQRLGLVVGDVDEGDAGAALQVLQLAAHLLAELGVEVGQRLVEQEDSGSTTRLRASATRCCWPPDSSLG